MTMPAEITVKLRVAVNEGDGVRRAVLTHPAFNGSLYIAANCEENLEVLLQNARLDKNKGVIESIVDDTTALMLLSGQLKEAVKDLRK
jgi:hypothetical protein